MIVNYLLLNLIWLGTERFRFDADGGVPSITESDPIYEEYAEVALPFSHMQGLTVYKKLLNALGPALIKN